MMPRKFDRIVEDCLSRMDRGQSLQEILSVYPALAESIKPLLLVAMLSRALPQPVPGYTALRQGKNEMLAEMATMQAEGRFLEPKPIQPPRERVLDRWARSLKRLQPVYRFATLSVVLILAGGFFTLSASASGLAEDVFNTLFFSFEQIGDLLMVRPVPAKSLADNTIFSSDYGLPDSPDNQAGNYKTWNVDGNENEKKNTDLFENVDITQIQTRKHTLTTNSNWNAGQADEVMELDQKQVTYDKGVEEEEQEDEKAQTREANEDEKDLEKEEKEEEKEAKKEEKEEEKEAKKEEKEEEKEAKEDEKEADKIAKDDEKEADKEAKDAEKEEKEEEKDKDK